MVLRQRGEFDPPVIAEHLRAVVKQEGVAAEPELLFHVAKLGNGSMRDSLSLMDRVIATGEKKLTVKLLEELLGLPPQEVLGAMLDAVAVGDARGALERADELLGKGISIDQALEAMLDRLRDLMVLASCGPETRLVELSEGAREAEVARARKFDPAGLVHMIALCESVQRSAKNSGSPRALLDALLVRLAMTDKLADVTAVVMGRGAAGNASLPGSAAAKKR